jgi:hypothetical protein
MIDPNVQQKEKQNNIVDNTTELPDLLQSGTSHV